MADGSHIQVSQPVAKTCLFLLGRPSGLICEYCTLRFESQDACQKGCAPASRLGITCRVAEGCGIDSVTRAPYHLDRTYEKDQTVAIELGRQKLEQSIRLVLRRYGQEDQTTV